MSYLPTLSFTRYLVWKTTCKAQNAQVVSQTRISPLLVSGQVYCRCRAGAYATACTNSIRLARQIGVLSVVNLSLYRWINRVSKLVRGKRYRSGTVEPTRSKLIDTLVVPPC